MRDEDGEIHEYVEYIDREEGWAFRHEVTGQVPAGDSKDYIIDMITTEDYLAWHEVDPETVDHQLMEPGLIDMRGISLDHHCDAEVDDMGDIIWHKKV